MAITGWAQPEDQERSREARFDYHLLKPVNPESLQQQHHAAWLGETENGNLKELLVPYPSDQMRMWEISPRVNSPKNDDPSLWEHLHREPTQTTTDTLELLRD